MLLIGLPKHWHFGMNFEGHGRGLGKGKTLQAVAGAKAETNSNAVLSMKGSWREVVVDVELPRWVHCDHRGGSPDFVLQAWWASNWFRGQLWANCSADWNEQPSICNAFLTWSTNVSCHSFSPSVLIAVTQLGFSSPLVNTYLFTVTLTTIANAWSVA